MTAFNSDHDRTPTTTDQSQQFVDGRPRGAPGTLASVRRAFTLFLIAVNAIQIVVWLMICIIGWHIENPWWLWSAAGGALIIGGLRYAEKRAA
jgi:hypothetical protein